MKGQEMITGMAGLIVVISGFYSVTSTDDLVLNNVRPNTGDFNTVANTKLKVDAYEDRMPKELNYSANIAGIQLGDSAGSESSSLEWSSGDIPSYDDLESNFISNTRDILETQNGVLGCTGPDIGSVRVSDYGDGASLESDLDNPWIICSSDSTVANISLETDTLSTENSNNRYLALAENSSNLASGISGEFPSDWSGTGSGSKSCQDSISSSEEEEANQNARDNARSNAISDSSLASTLLSDYQSDNDFPSWVSIDTNSYFSVEYSQTSSSTPSCTYDHSGHLVNCDEDGNNCETHEHDDGESYSTDYSATVTDVTVEYTLSDSERDVINSEGEMETLDFTFNYTE